MSADKGPKKSNCRFATLCRPVNKYNVLYYYAPLASLGTYGALSVNIMNPSLVTKYVSQKDITNVLLGATLAGSSLYLYGRNHLSCVPAKKRAAYSATGGLLFSFGSVLSWAVIRSFLRQDQNLLATILGLGTGIVITKMGIDYVNHLDTTVAKCSPPKDSRC